MDFSLTAIIALISGTIFGYLSKVWQWAIWRVRIPLDVMQILIRENKDLGGRNIKFLEDKVDPLNPTQDSGMLLNKSWICSYRMSERNKEGSFSFFGGGSDLGDLTYSISTSRNNRKKLLRIIEESMYKKAIERNNKIFIVTGNSIYFVGDINEQYLEIPKVIEDRLNDERKTRLNIFLHGSIGTGKTTLSRAIAQRLGMPIYILAINSWWEVTDFVKALQRIPDDSVILFDDIDLILEQLLRADVDKNYSPLPLKFSTASIMAFLDGIFMKQKRWVVIMCTNQPDKVRKLLRLRPGRVHIDFACTEVYISDYIEAAKEAKEIIDQYKKEIEAKKKEETPAKEVSK